MYKKIKSKKDISLLFKNGLYIKSSKFLLIHKKNNLNINRFAILVSKKNGSAVFRNRLKRVYREVFRENLEIDSCFLDILMRPNIGSSADYITIKKEFIKCQKKLKKYY